MAEGPPPRAGLIVGRFQPLHWGHVRLVEWVRGDGAVVHLGIGSSQFGNTRENPFTASERRRIIGAANSALGLRVERIDEVPDIFDDEKWVEHVVACCGRFDTVYSNNEWTAGLFTEAGYEVRATPMFDRERYEGSKLREAIKERGLDSVADLIPSPVMAVLKEIDAEKRIRTCWKTPTPARR
jgi:nicotinamide-nucleotide adenylyltransferase